MSNIPETISKNVKMRLSNIQYFYKYSKAYGLAYKRTVLKQFICILDKFNIGEYRYDDGIIKVINENHLFEDNCYKVILISHIRSKYYLCIGYPRFREFSLIRHIRIEKNNEFPKLTYKPIDVPTQDLNNLCHFMMLIMCKNFIYVVKKYK